MAAHQNFDLDRLGSTTRFEQLCYALLLHYFGTDVVPYGALGPDGGVDARLDGLPASYTTLDGTPLLYGARKPVKNGFWVFQAKYHQHPYRATIAKADLDKEWKLWKTRKPKPDYFIFLTNVVLSPALHKTFISKIKKPKPFKFFDYWDGEKIAALVAANPTIRSSFFPNCEDNGAMLSQILDLVTDQSEKKTKVKKRPKKKTPKKRATKAAAAKAYLSSVEELARYEGAFAKANDEIVGRFKNDAPDIPKGWKSKEIKARSGGILQLGKSGKDLVLSLIEASKSQSVIVKIWEKFLGEQVEKGDTILKLAYDPEEQQFVDNIESSMFSVAHGTIEVHKSIDTELQSVAQKAIQALRDDNTFTTEETLRHLFSLKSQYIEARRKYGVGFFPNSRSMGRMVFGWSFLSVWDKAFERICDVLMSKVQPDDLYRLVATIPEGLASAAIDNRMPPEEILSELNSLSFLIFRSQEKKVTRLEELLYQNLENVYDHFHDMNHRLENLADAKWAFSVAEVMCDFAAEIARYSLTKKLNIGLDFAVRLIGKATGIHFSHNVSIAQDETFSENYESLKAIDSANSKLQQQMSFAIGTFAWSLVRKGRRELTETAVSNLKSISMKRIVELYERNDGLRRWFSWWFVPEGKRVVWSSRPDHDIREALELRLLLEKPQVEDLLGLGLLENAASFDSFIKDLEGASTLISELDLKPRPTLDEVTAVLTEARTKVVELRKAAIRANNVFSERKMAEIEKSFLDFMAKHDPSGVLYRTKIEADPEFKPTHFVGVFTLQDKEWFLENAGHTSFSVNGMGANWAEAIVGGRESLMAKEIEKAVKFESVKLDDLSGLLEKVQNEYDESHVLCAHSIGIPWSLRQKFILNEHQLGPGTRKFTPGQIGRIGKVDVFPGRYLKRGQIVLMPKDTFTWLNKGKCLGPRVSLIDPESKEARGVLKKNPEMDLNLKVIVEAREFGTMTISDGKLASVRAWKVKGKDEDLI